MKKNVSYKLLNKEDFLLNKMILAAALCATTTFAAVDRFAVLENHKGELSFGSNFTKQGEHKDLIFDIQSRYTILPNLELGMTLPYDVSLDKDHLNGLMMPFLGARYQFIPSLRAFLSVGVPTMVGPYSSWVFEFGIQESQKWGLVNLGSFLGLEVETEGEDNISSPMSLNFGVETIFDLGVVNPFVCANGTMKIGKYEGKLTDTIRVNEDVSGHVGVWLSAGVIVAINSDVEVSAGVGTAVGKEDVVGHDRLINVSLGLKVAI